MTEIRVWIQAARLRTLPLAISTMIMGHALASSDGFFNLNIAILSVFTAICLQVLSNFANDYGDSIHGADNITREGPRRAVQSGLISLRSMKRSLYIFSALALMFGLCLVYIAFDDWLLRGVFLFLGILAIWAAVNYTAGSKPYGYSGKGDIAVFIFFGLVTVLGSYYLQAKVLRWPLIFPAITCGLLSVGVLNINNIRDIESDKLAGKMSIPVKIGRQAAITYHGCLLLIGAMCLAFYGVLESFGISLKWLFVLALPLLIINFNAVRSRRDPKELDPYLKHLALSTSGIILLFSVSLFL